MPIPILPSDVPVNILTGLPDDCFAIKSILDDEFKVFNKISAISFDPDVS